MVTLRDALLPVANKLRQLPTKFGIRLYTVSVIVKTYTGPTVFGVPGEGTENIQETELVLDGYGGFVQPKVTVVSTRDIIASGGLYKDGDYKIDFITPSYNNIYGVGGVAVNIFEPDENTVPTEITFKLSGPEFPGGALFKKIQTYTYRPFHYTIVVRKIGVQP